MTDYVIDLVTEGGGVNHPEATGNTARMLWDAVVGPIIGDQWRVCRNIEGAVASRTSAVTMRATDDVRRDMVETVGEAAIRMLANY